jgi:NAD(P)-binding Rossmann-like domain
MIRTSADGSRPVHIIGGGIAGLVAAITAAEGGAPVILHEASVRVGGRALGRTSWAGVNLGPHVVLTDGALVRWLRARSIGISLRRPALRGVRLLGDEGTGIPALVPPRLAATVIARQAPVDESFRAWSDRVFGPARSELMCRLAGLFTFHHDPGTLSAQFVWSRYRRVFVHPDRIRMVAGGWSALAEALAGRAVACGVRIEAGEKVTAATFPGGPTVVATRLPAASRLLERELRWPGARTALMDVAVSPGQRRWPGTVIDIRGDLRTCCLVDRLTATFPDLVGDRGADVFQAQLGISGDTSRADAAARIERTFDEAAGGWRDRVVWQRSLILADATGAVDPPGATWRDRPAIEQGDDRFLAGDTVAAPGMLSEVAVNSGIDAARRALQARRHHVFAPGWPTAELTPARRLAVLAAALPGACAITADRPDGEAHPWSGEPADQTGVGYRLAMRAGVLRGEATGPQPDGTRTTVLAWNRLPGRAGRLVSHWLARRWE